MSEQKVVKKKVQPYPFAAELDLNNQKKQIEFIYMNTKGGIVRLLNSLVFVGEYYQVTFEIPAMKATIDAQVRIMKTYDKVVYATTKKVEREAELHFQNLTERHKSRIVAFMRAIGQDK